MKREIGSGEMRPTLFFQSILEKAIKGEL